MLSDKQESLLSAAHEGDIDVVRELIKLHPDPDIVNCDGDTALILAVSQGHTDVVRELIKLRPDPNIVDSEGNTALILAAYGGHADIVWELIKLRPDPNIMNRNCDTALIQAAYEGHANIVRELIKLRPDPDVVNSAGNTALILAASEGHTDVVQELIKLRPDPDISDSDGDTAIILAERSGFQEVVDMLENAKSNRNDVNKFRCKRDAAVLRAVKAHATEKAIESSMNSVLRNFRANTTSTNAKEKSFKDNQIINITLNDMIKQFSYTYLNILQPVFQHLSEVAAGHAHQRTLAKLNGKKIPWVEHDMHEQYVAPAMTSVQAVMRALQRDADILKKPFGLRIIVGKGNGSVDKVPKIKNAFLKHLDDNEIEWWYPELHNTGLVAIVFWPNKGESADLLS